MDDLVSVILPVYNTEQSLNRTLDCISQQTYRNLEIILVDDGSTDSSGHLCDIFADKDPRCKVIHKPNGGQGSAKNAGQKVATGDFLFFPDSDDTFNLDMIRLLHEAIQRDPSYDFAFSRFKNVADWDTDTSPVNCTNDDIRIIEYSRDELIGGLFGKSDDRFVYGWNKLYKKELLDNLWCGDYSRHQDFDFNYRVFLKTRKAVFVDMELYHWVQWSGSKTHQRDTWDLYYRCRTDILYNNWVHLSRDDKGFEHYLLDALYRAMVFWEEWSRKSGLFTESKTQCKKYVKGSFWRYLSCKKIGFGRKTICIMMLSFPALSHVIMKVTNNAR